MKSNRAPKAFEPVHLILESQEEVDALFSLFNYSPVAELFPCLNNAYSFLEEFANQVNCDKHHDTLNAKLKRAK